MYQIVRTQPKKRFWNVTLILIALNVLFYLAIIALQYAYGDSIFQNIAIQPSFILKGERLWTIVTSMFMHDPNNVIHLAVNMLSLLFLGGFLEKLIGSKKFLSIYLISGIIASLAFVLLTSAFGENLTIPAVGASGAIFGIGGMLAVLTPRVPVYMMFIPIPMPMWLGIVLMLILIWVVSAVAGLPIGNFAHLGGFIAGLAYGFYLRIKNKKKMKILDRYFR